MNNNKNYKTLSDDKWVRILSDHCSTGIWASDGSCCEFEELPVSDYIKEKLKQWQKDYDIYCDDWKNEDEHTWKHKKEFHNAWGLIIAKEIKRQLPNWTVLFFDSISAEKIQYVVGDDRSSFEYEIK